MSEAHESPPPGETCPTCERRMPYPKKLSSPGQNNTSYRMPKGEKEAHEAVMVAWAQHWGVHKLPHWKFKLFTMAAAEALSGPPREYLDGE